MGDCVRLGLFGCIVIFLLVEFEDSGFYMCVLELFGIILL